jgi:hypothetical protein
MKLKIPTKPSDVTLEQVQKVLLIDKMEDMDEFAKKVHSVAVMCRRTPHEIGQVVLEDLDRIYDNIFAMINKPGDEQLRRYLKYLGREYAFIEDVRDMETGAFIDIDQMTQQDKYAENLHKIMAVLYRPVDAKLGDRYRLKSYVKEDPKEREQRQAIFLQEMTYDVVKGAAGFFLLVTQKCLSILDDSFQVPGVETLMRMIRGGGINLFTQSQDTAS